MRRGGGRRRRARCATHARRRAIGRPARPRGCASRRSRSPGARNRTRNRHPRRTSRRTRRRRPGARAHRGRPGGAREAEGRPRAPRRRRPCASSRTRRRGARRAASRSRATHARSRAGACLTKDAPSRATRASPGWRASRARGRHWHVRVFSSSDEAATNELHFFDPTVAKQMSVWAFSSIVPASTAAVQGNFLAISDAPLDRPRSGARGTVPARVPAARGSSADALAAE